MPFSDEVVHSRFWNCTGKCECTLQAHGHSERCDNAVMYKNRGPKGYGCWEAHHLTPEEDHGPDTFENCRIFCWPCHEKTLIAQEDRHT